MFITRKFKHHVSIIQAGERFSFDFVTRHAKHLTHFNFFLQKFFRDVVEFFFGGCHKSI